MSSSFIEQGEKIEMKGLVTEYSTKQAVQETRERKQTRDYGKCTIQPAAVPEQTIQSTFTASYPGSGAKMTWKLIEGITGLGKLLMHSTDRHNPNCPFFFTNHTFCSNWR